jgi:hypothetical protein
MQTTCGLDCIPQREHGGGAQLQRIGLLGISGCHRGSNRREYRGHSTLNTKSDEQLCNLQRHSNALLCILETVCTHI